jgi:diguanylate cyclase (GGDEF)-like protein
MASPQPDVAGVLIALTRALSKREATLEQSLQAVTDAALDMLPGDHASIRLLDKSSAHLLASARSGRGTHIGSLTLKRGEGVAGWVIDHGEGARIEDARKDPRFKAAVGQGFQIGSMVAEPLVSAGHVIGVLSVSSPEVKAFSEDDGMLARLLANCSVPPIERARLERIEKSDELTLALSEAQLVPQLKAAVDAARAERKTVSVLAMDLDGLAHVNDCFGREVGDRVLCIVADRVRARARLFDVLVRSDGDRFMLIMPATPLDQAEALADRVRKEMGEEPMEPVPGGFITQTLSIGVIGWDGREAAEALRERAVKALDEAKAKGKNRVAVGAAPAR